MELMNAIKERRSIRKFKKDAIDDKIMEKIVEAGIWAPSAGNLQSWEVIMVKNPEIKSLTKLWAPNPKARPAIPAPVSKGAIFTPTSERTIKTAIK